MKKVALLSLVALFLVLTACKREEQLRVESVVGVYNCFSNCQVTNLVTQDPPVTSQDTTILHVTTPYDDENGFVALRGQEVFLEEDFSFRLSKTNYSLIGEFDQAGGLTFTIDSIDTQSQMRSQCSYTCQLQ